MEEHQYVKQMNVWELKKLDSSESGADSKSLKLLAKEFSNPNISQLAIYNLMQLLLKQYFTKVDRLNIINSINW